MPLFDSEWTETNRMWIMKMIWPNKNMRSNFWTRYNRKGKFLNIFSTKIVQSWTLSIRSTDFLAQKLQKCISLHLMQHYFLLTMSPDRSYLIRITALSIRAKWICSNWSNFLSWWKRISVWFLDLKLQVFKD